MLALVLLSYTGYLWILGGTYLVWISIGAVIVLASGCAKRAELSERTIVCHLWPLVLLLLRWPKWPR